jgi:thioredoxin-related protein
MKGFKMSKCKNIFFLVVLLSFTSSAQDIISFEKLDSLQQIKEKPVIIFFYTSWCRYCHVMKNSTFKHNEVKNILNEKFYFVAFDIEEKKDIKFRGTTYKFKPNGINTGVHQLAEKLGTTEGELRYPLISILNTDYEIIYQKEGFISSSEFIVLLIHLKL